VTKKIGYIYRFLCLCAIKSRKKIIGKLPEIAQRELFHPMLKDFIDPHHKLALLADATARR
jgi:hypothetical protein